MRLLDIKCKEIKSHENSYQFCRNLFSNNVAVSNKRISNYLKDISLSNLPLG